MLEPLIVDNFARAAAIAFIFLDYKYTSLLSSEVARISEMDDAWLLHIYILPSLRIIRCWEPPFTPETCILIITSAFH